MTSNKQMRQWVEGKSIHNIERDECCPDFSCCNPELLANKEDRKLFYECSQIKRTDVTDKMLMDFLSKAFANKNIYVAGTIDTKNIAQSN